MDLKVSRKEKRWQQRGAVMELVDNVFDIYPILDEDDRYLLKGAEIITDPKEEVLDRAMFALCKQRGADPLSLNDGIQWAQAVSGEIPASLILAQVRQAVTEAGPNVRVLQETTPDGVAFTIELIPGV